MVDVSKIENLQRARSSGEDPTPQQEAKGASRLVWTLVRDQLLKQGQSIQSQQDVGPALRNFLKAVTEDLLAAVEPKTGKVPAAAIQTAVHTAIDLFGKESHVNNKPSSVTEANGELLKKVDLREQPNGKIRVVGEASADTHGLSILLKGLGVDIGGLEKPVADIIGKAANSRNYHNLGRFDTWTKVGRDVLIAVLGTPGTPHTKGIAGALAGLVSLGDALEQPALPSGPKLTSGSKTVLDTNGSGQTWTQFSQSKGSTDSEKIALESGSKAMKGGLLALVAARTQENGLKDARRRAAQLTQGLATSLGLRDPQRVQIAKTLAQTLAQHADVDDAAAAIFKSLGVESGAEGGSDAARMLHTLYQAVRGSGGFGAAEETIVAAALTEKIAVELGAEPGVGAQMARKLLEDNGLPFPASPEPTSPNKPQPKDLSHLPAPEALHYPDSFEQDEGFRTFLDSLLPVKAEGGNLAVAIKLGEALYPLVEELRGREGENVSLTDPRQQTKIFEAALRTIEDTSPLASALLELRSHKSSEGSGPSETKQRLGVMLNELKGRERGAQILEALLDKNPAGAKALRQSLQEAKARLPADAVAQREQLEAQSAALEAPDSPQAQQVVKDLLVMVEHPSTLAELHGQLADALENPQAPKSQTILAQQIKRTKGHLSKVKGLNAEAAAVLQTKLQVFQHAIEGKPPTEERANTIQEFKDIAAAYARQTQGETPAPKEWVQKFSASLKQGIESMEAQAAAIDEATTLAQSTGEDSWLRAAATVMWDHKANEYEAHHHSGGQQPPRRPGEKKGSSLFDEVEQRMASLGGKPNDRQAEIEDKKSIEAATAILNDPSIDFFDRIFLFLTLLVERHRKKIERDMIGQLDSEERMWIHEQGAHEKQKEVEIIQRDIHEIGKKLEPVNTVINRAEREIARIEKVPETDRTQEQKAAHGKAHTVLEDAKDEKRVLVEAFESKQVQLERDRGKRDAHRVEIASDRRSIDIQAAVVKRNTHLVEMLMDMIKTFDDHRNRNLQRIWSN